MHAPRLHRQLAVVLGDVVVTEERLPGDDMHIERVQEAHILGQIGDGMMLHLFGQRMLKRHVDTAIAILNIKDHSIAACSFPALYQFNSMSAAGSSSGHIYGSDF